MNIAFHPIPDGWRFYSADNSIQGKCYVRFMRDENAGREWRELPFEVQATTDLFVNGVSYGLAPAWAEAIALAEARPMPVTNPS